MASRYTGIFSNPYPSGWANLPSIKTPIIAQALQQYTNTLLNIERFLETYQIPSDISELNDSSNIIPSKLSQLLNDTQFITKSDIPRIPTKLSQLQNDRKYITKGDIPKNLSSYINDIGFITNVVNNLLNYYAKSETYSKVEIDNILKDFKKFDIKVVDELPTTNISTTTIYCVPKSQDNVQTVDAYIIDLEPYRDDNISTFIDIGDIVETEEIIGGVTFDD